MEFDFSSKTGYQKFIIFLAGMVGTILVSVFNISPDKTNQLVTIATALAPIAASVLFAIFNQIAAMGKAKTEIAKITATAEAVAVTGKPIIPVALPAPTIITPEAPPVFDAFDKDVFAVKVNKKASLYTVDGKVTKTSEFFAALDIAKGEPATNLQQSMDANYFVTQAGKEAYYDKSGHTYGTGAQHLGDVNSTCPFTSVRQMARAQGYETTMDEITRLEANVAILEIAWQKGIDIFAQIPDMYKTLYMVGEWARVSGIVK